MAVVMGVPTGLARQYFPQFFGRLLGISAGASTVGNWNPFFRSFKIGRGGWIDPGGGPVPRVPDATFVDLDVIIDQARVPLSMDPPRYSSLTGNVLFMEKTLQDVDFSFVAPSTILIRCTLDFGEFNDISGVPSNPPGGPTLPTTGTSPELYELGVFTDHPSGTGELMVLYGTFTAEVKNGTKRIENDVRLSF